MQWRSLAAILVAGLTSLIAQELGGGWAGETTGPTPRSKPAADYILTTSEYYFEMNKERRGEFVSRSKTIKLGNSRVDVIKRLGPPDLDQINAPKFPMTPDADQTFRELRYYVRRLRKDSVNQTHDQMLEFFFNGRTDRLESMASSVPEIPSLNFPPRR